MQDWKSQSSFSISPIGAIAERERAAVRLGDLAAQHQPDTGPISLRRVKGDEEVRAVRDAVAFIEHM
jgi:hypothetical protein